MPDQAGAISNDETLLASFRPYLSDDNELLRCAAVKALPAVLNDPEALRTVLTEALLDPDPDVRSDAMEALAEVARPEDADTIRRSLEGDPVREVKLAAVTALAHLHDRGSVDLFRSLVLSRSDDLVAWEDEGGDWEDWLDIQIAVISALGEMGIAEAIDDLLAARQDEFGQTVDVEVFDAFARMGADGVDQLLAAIQTEEGLARQRAADALTRVSPATLQSRIDVLLASRDPQLRQIAVKAMTSDDMRVRECAMIDPDAAVRLAALHHAAALYPDLAIHALSDRDPAVQAAALDYLRPPLAAEINEALVDNLLLWLDKAPPVLMTAAARHLPAFAPDRATQPLLALIGNGDRPLEARVAAVSALGSASPLVAAETFTDLLTNPARQVRTAVLVVLRARATAGDAAAIETITGSIAGTLLADDHPSQNQRDDESGPDVATPKGEGAGPRTIRITPEGEIVEMDRSPQSDGASQSTLSAILSGASPPEPAMAEDTPEESSAKRRKRRPVEGPDAIAETLCCDAMQVCADLGLESVETAILTRVQDSADPVRRTAWQALERHCAVSEACEGTRVAAHAAFEDTDPMVRLAAFTVLTRVDKDPELIAAAQRDPDVLLRAAAVAALPAEAALNHLADDALAVRKAAVDRVLACGSDATLSSAVDRLVVAERADTLAAVMAASEPAAAKALSALSRDGVTARKALVLLKAFAGLRGETA